jgi:hypothetical protein
MYDLETDEQFEAAGTPTACPAEPTTDGPCSVNIQFYSALEFASGMGNAAELTFDRANLVRDSCGRFAVGGLPTVPMSAYAVGARPAASDTTRRLAGIVAVAAPGEQLNNLRLYTMRTSTDMTWSTSAGLTDGTFASKGLYVHLFLREGQPVSGVTATFNGAAQAANDYYFTDTGPLERTMVSNTATATGANGLALITGNGALSLNAYGGSGGGCTYAGVSGGTIRGVVVVQPRPDCAP